MLACILRPLTGANEINFFNPFFARSVVASSRRAPKAIINATSPAANISPMAIAANIAMEINRADEILLIPLLYTILRIDKYTRGKPQIITVIQEGSKGNIFEMVSVHQTPLSNAESHQAVKIAPLKSSYINQIIYHVFDVPYNNPLIRLSLPI